MYPQFVCCRKYIYRERRSRNLLNPQKKGREKCFCRMGILRTYVYVYAMAQCMEIVSKHCIDEQKIGRSIKPKMKMNDCKWFFHFSCGGFFLLLINMDGCSEVIFGFVGCEIFKSKKIFSADFVWILLYIMRISTRGMALFVCIMYEVEVFLFFSRLILIEYWTEQQMWLINWKARVA